MPELTAEQKSCLDSKIGDPKSGARPNREQVRSAFEACGVQAPAHPPRGFGPQLTDEQKACLDGKVGRPESGARPSREQMDAALTACGIERPQRHGANNTSNESVDELKLRFANATTDEEKEAVRAAMRKTFHSTEDRAIQAQVRDFFKSNPETITWTSPGVEVRAAARVTQ